MEFHLPLTGFPPRLTPHSTADRKICNEVAVVLTLMADPTKNIELF
jgi:hypothetical protein